MGKKNSFRDFLSGLDLEQETVDSIMAQHGLIISKDKERITELEGQLKDSGTLQTQLNDANTKYSQLEASFNSQKTELEQAKSTHEAEIVKMMIENDLSKKFRDPKDVYGQLDLNAIKREDGKLVGLEEQTKTILETKPYLGIDNSSSRKRSSSLDHINNPGDGLDQYRAIYGLSTESTDK